MKLLNARASRTIYWSAWAMLLAIHFVIFMVVSSAEVSVPIPTGIIIGMLAILYVGWIMVCAARCRDMGKSGWLALLILIPFVGVLAFLWFGIAEGVY